MILKDLWSPKDKTLQARDEIFDFKKEFPTLFTVTEEEFEREQLAREQKLEEDTITKKKQNVDHVFKILLDSIVESGVDQRVVTQYNTHMEIVDAIKKCQINGKIYAHKSLQSILNIALLLRIAKTKFQRKYSKTLGGSWLLKVLWLLHDASPLLG